MLYDIKNTSMEQDLNNLDLSKVAALQQKRTLAFVNHFVMTTVQFLNNFMKQCEHKLMMYERKLEKVEASLVLLETRLSSIPEVENISAEPKKAHREPEQELNKVEIASSETSVHVEENNATDQDSVAVSPEYERFVKMVQVGVPLPAVKLKASLEGLDPSILEKCLHR